MTAILSHLKEIGITVQFRPFDWRLRLWHEGGNSFLWVGPFSIFTHSPI